jgi:hypothetical protein
MTKPIYKRCSLTLDTETIWKSRELADQTAQSVSSLVRLLVRQAYDVETGAKNGVAS